MIRRMIWFVLVSVLATAGIALGLILSQRPQALPPGVGLDFSGILNDAPAVQRPLSPVRMRDGFALQVRRYPSAMPDAPLLVLVHGSGWHSQQFDGLAHGLSKVADVVTPDLRGHGPMPGTRGDIAYIEQFEDDLADLITAEAKPGQKVVVGGHSSGGGLVVRFSGGSHGAMLDAAVLIAPFLRHDAPTARHNSGGWAYPLTRRIIGLSMFNAARIKALNGLTVIQFRMPQAVLDGPLGHTATTAYSYRLNTGFAPRRDYLKDVQSLPPFLLIAGTADEAFDAAQFERTMSAVNDKGQFLLVEGMGHLDIVSAPEIRQHVEAFLGEL